MIPCSHYPAWLLPGLFGCPDCEKEHARRCEVVYRRADEEYEDPNDGCEPQGPDRFVEYRS